MSFWIVPPVANLAEIAIAPEIHIDGVGAIEFINGSIRLYLYADQLPLEGGAPQKMVAAKLIGPVTALPMIIGQLALCMVADHKGMPPPGKPRLVS